MTIWVPNLEGRSGPRYKAIADAIGDAIRTGELPPGEKLPTHRDLAYRLGVTVGTVSRAYSEVERRELVSGEVGRGTYVREATNNQFNFLSAKPQSDSFDFGLNFPPLGGPNDSLREVFGDLARENDLSGMLSYQPEQGLERHRQIIAGWVKNIGFSVTPDRVVVSNGGQHGMTLCLMALTRPGDVVLVEEMTYPGMKNIAAQLGVRLVGVAMDGEGLRLDALESAIKAHNPRALYCMPSFQNPTSVFMGEDRRRAIAKLVDKYGIWVMEDDVYGLQQADRPAPICEFVPERGFYINSFAKCLAAGLRLGYVISPPEMAANLAACVRMTCWMASPLNAEIGCRWIERGLALQTIAWHQNEALVRRAAAIEALSGCEFLCEPGSYHLWLKLPEPWDCESFARQARSRNVVVMPASTFAVGRVNATHAVRVCLGAANSITSIREGMKRLAYLMRETPRPDLAVM